MTTIENLYYGNINPCENMIRDNENYKDLLRLYSRNQEKLLSTLTEDRKNDMKKYIIVKMSWVENLKSSRL